MKLFYLAEPQNGGGMVISTMTSLGFSRTENQNEADVIWTQVHGDIQFDKLKQNQIVNHIKNMYVITKKNNLYTTLTNFTAVAIDFLPMTFRLDLVADHERFLKIITSPLEKKKEKEEKSIWILKPQGSNQGRGIELSKNLNELHDRFKSKRENLVVQQYLTAPLLLEGRKFDMRIYMFVASVRDPELAFYHQGYCRLSHCKYSTENISDRLIHLTNAAIQRQHPQHKEKEEETIWNFDLFREYMEEKTKMVPINWVDSVLIPKVKFIMKQVFSAALKTGKLFGRESTQGFDLLGLDFILDSNLKLYLLEVNSNPALWTTCSTTKALLPSMIDETLKIALEVNQKKKSNQNVLPLTSVKEFQQL